MPVRLSFLALLTGVEDDAGTDNENGLEDVLRRPGFLVLQVKSEGWNGLEDETRTEDEEGLECGPLLEDLNGLDGVQ